MNFLSFAPSTLAIWVAAFSAWAIWRQFPPILEYGIWGVTNSTRTVFVAAVLLGLSVVFLYALRHESKRTVTLFGFLAVMVATPPIFVGASANLPVFGYSYYAGFDWIASTWVQLVWLALVLLSVLYFSHKAVVHERFLQRDTAMERSPYQIWMTTLYWVLTAWFTVLALNAVSPFWSGTWIDLFEDITSGEHYRLRFRAQNVLIVAIAMALWMRSGAALWLIAVWAVAFHLSSFFTLSRYISNHGNDTPRDFWLQHPALILLIVLAVVLVQRARVIRPF